MRGDEILLLGIEIQPPSQKLLPVMCLKLVIAGLPQAWPIATSILFKKKRMRTVSSINRHASASAR